MPPYPRSQTLSQNKSEATQTLCIQRVSIGDDATILWDKDFTRKHIERLSVATKEIQQITKDKPKNFVNSYRFNLSKEPHQWIWLIDADVTPTKSSILKALDLIESVNPEVTPIIGGFYLNDPNANIFEKSYNHLCNIWSSSNKIALAGNVLIHKSLFNNLESTRSSPFGQEEKALNLQLNHLNKQFLLTDQVSLPHLNKKNFFSFLKTAWQQGKVHNSQNRPIFGYLKNLIKHFKPHPLETLLTLTYLGLSLTSTYWASLTHLMIFKRSSSY